jgi:hypothetical protein
MIIYVGRNYTAAMAGAVVRDVACEKCGCAYHYKLVRRGQGTGSAPYYIGQGSAQRRAESGARDSVERLLARDIDPVPCPDCGWFQADMVREVRRRSLRWLRTVAIFGGILTAGALLIYLPAATEGLNRPMRTEDQIVTIVLATAVILSIAGPILLRRMLLNARDPNRYFPERPIPIPGAPRPWKDGDDPFAAAPASPVNEPANAATLAYQRMPAEVEPGGWVTVQLLDMPVPGECCMCLNPTPDAIAMKKGQLTAVPVKVCPACRAALNRRRWRWALGTAALFAAGAVACALTPNFRWGVQGTAIFAGIVAFVGLLPGLIIGEVMSHPARLGRFDGRLNTLRIRFRNRDYAPVFAATMAAMPPAGRPANPLAA